MPAVPIDLYASGDIPAFNRDLPLTGPGRRGSWIWMPSIVRIGKTAIPAKSAIVAPEKRRVVAIHPTRLLAWVNFENVSRVVNRERIVPIQHTAHGAVALPFETIRLCSRSGNPDENGYEYGTKKKYEFGFEQNGKPPLLEKFFRLPVFSYAAPGSLSATLNLRYPFYSGSDPVPERS